MVTRAKVIWQWLQRMSRTHCTRAAELTVEPHDTQTEGQTPLTSAKIVCISCIRCSLKILGCSCIVYGALDNWKYQLNATHAPIDQGWRKHLVSGPSVLLSAWSLHRNSSTVCSQWHCQCHWQPANCRCSVTRPQFCLWHRRSQHVTVSTQAAVWCLRFCAVVVSVLSVWEDSEFPCEWGIVWSGGGKLKCAIGFCTEAHLVHLLHGGLQYCTVFHYHRVRHHLCADDKQPTKKCQFMTSVELDAHSRTVYLTFANWCSSRRLQLNASKTELIWFGTQHSLNKVSGDNLTLQIDSGVIHPVSVVCDLGVMLDSELTM